MALRYPPIWLDRKSRSSQINMLLGGLDGRSIVRTSVASTTGFNTVQSTDSDGQAENYLLEAGAQDRSTHCSESLERYAAEVPASLKTYGAKEKCRILTSMAT